MYFTFYLLDVKYLLYTYVICITYGVAIIDRRLEKGELCETDEELQRLSDTQIINEFGRALGSLYPHLMKVNAHCYDPYYDIAEAFYYNYVYMTFAAKYGVPIPYGEHHKCEFGLHCYRKINHIECKPKKYPIPVGPGSKVVLNESDMSDKVFCLDELGPKGIGLSDHVEKSELPNKVFFDHVSIAIANEDSGYRYKDEKFAGVYSHIDNWEFTFVAESFSKKEHLHYINRFHEDLCKT